MTEQDLRDKVKDVLEMPLTEIDFDTDQCVQIAIDYAREEAIGFSEWKDKNTYPHPFEENKYQFFSWHNDQTTYTLSEIYEIYLTTKTK